MPISAPEPLLAISGLRAGYGKIGVLHGVDLTIAAGEIVALLGPNGAGKTTLLRAASGLLPWSAGEVSFAGRDLRGVGVRRTARLGLVHVVEGHRVFTQLSVLDNLLLAGYELPRAERTARAEEALGFFPEIATKRHDRSNITCLLANRRVISTREGTVEKAALSFLFELNQPVRHVRQHAHFNLASVPSVSRAHVSDTVLSHTQQRLV